MKIDTLIDALRHERYRWTPTRRVYVEKKNSNKLRPLGIPTWSDKLLQEVIRSILEAYYEPQSSRYSHGFRPERGCHTALTEIERTWRATTWFIEADISRCFDTLNHSILLSFLCEKIHDNRFLRLIENLLKAGYLEDWKYNTTLSGTPQGGVVSPVLANVYLDRLDQFVETTLLPAYNRGAERQKLAEYSRLKAKAHRLERAGRQAEAQELWKRLKSMPSRDPHDPNYRRLRYIRYADDFLLGFCGPRSEAEEIKDRLGEFLRESLKLELSEAKTLVTHARSQAARFLGYEIVVHHNDHKHDHDGQRSINGTVGLKVPLDVVRAKCRPYTHHGKPTHRTERTHDTVFSIVAQFQQEYRGLVEYYRLAYNRHRLNRLKWVMEQSLTKTLAAKLRISVAQVYDRYQAVLHTDHGPRKGLRVTVERGDDKAPLVAEWGGIALVRRRNGTLNDQPPRVWNRRTELEQRLLADTCELCGSHERVEVHHIRALKDLQAEGRTDKPEWVRVMAARHRKTLVVCRACHLAIHRGRARCQT